MGLAPQQMDLFRSLWDRGIAFVVAAPCVVGKLPGLSMLLSPVLGNRGYCRYLCPYGATFGLLNRVGFYRIDYQAQTCTDCGTCQ
ncbi:MAG: Glutamate synthase beta subunit protein [Rhodospirillaceae bacterium]|nr:MAG: Glutamate synthase beta subunit protein [Rhodospirillaceae bacterium]